MNRRLDEVKRQLLSSPHETIERISFLCGFENPISLKNCFRRRMGLSMRDYRRQQLAGVATGASRKPDTKSAARD